MATSRNSRQLSTLYFSVTYRGVELAANPNPVGNASLNRFLINSLGLSGSSVSLICTVRLFDGRIGGVNAHDLPPSWNALPAYLAPLSSLPVCNLDRRFDR